MDHTSIKTCSLIFRRKQTFIHFILLGLDDQRDIKFSCWQSKSSFFGWVVKNIKSGLPVVGIDGGNMNSMVVIPECSSRLDSSNPIGMRWLAPIVVS